jgi:hypothetical protein
MVNNIDTYPRPHEGTLAFIGFGGEATSVLQ